MYVFTVLLTDINGRLVHRSKPCRVDNITFAYSAAHELTRDFPQTVRMVVDIVLPPKK